MSDPLSYNYCAMPLAAYACRPDRSEGRIYLEGESAYRTPFQRDRDRIIHSSAFRRLKDKTQVFISSQGDHFRTRLTHTLEVAQVARTLARALMVNEDLAETVALAHDLGHTPFAHVAETALDECMKDVGGYDHNDQSLRVVTMLERKYAGWPGLNLTWETLEGIVKHNGPVKGPLPVTLKSVQGQTDLRLNTYASLEAQTAAIADDIAYNNHDVEDGLSAGLFTLNDIEEVALLAEAKRISLKTSPGVDDDLLRAAIVREVIGMMVDDVLTETRARIAALKPQSPDDIRAAKKQTVAFSAAMYEKVEALRKFLWTRMYRHPEVNAMSDKGVAVVRDLYSAFMDDPSKLPHDWQQRVNVVGGRASMAPRARVVADYIAGMTDRFAMREHERLFVLKQQAS